MSEKAKYDFGKLERLKTIKVEMEKKLIAIIDDYIVLYGTEDLKELILKMLRRIDERDKI